MCCQSSASLPASPYALYRSSSQFTWRLQSLTPQSAAAAAAAGALRPLVQPCLENLDLPYADDSAAATPTSDDLCTFQNAQNNLTLQRQQRLSSASAGFRLSQLEMRFGGGGGGVSRTSSRASRQSRRSVVASNIAALAVGATTQLEVHTPRLKVKRHFFSLIVKADGRRGGSVCTAVCLYVFQTIYEKPMQLGSTNMTYKFSTMSSGQHQYVDRTPRERVNQNDRGQN